MLEAITYSRLIKDLRERHGDADGVPVGILFGDANSLFMKEHILIRINQYHHRSAVNVDFYFPGYGAYWHDCFGQQITVCNVDGIDWLYSDRLYVDFINKIESVSSWRFSGEVELMLLNYRHGQLDFSEVMVFWLDRMVQDQIIYSPANYFEMLFRRFRRSRTVYQTSDYLALQGICNSILDEIQSKIPLGKCFAKNKYFCTYDMRK